MGEILFALKGGCKTDRTSLSLGEICEVRRSGQGVITPDIPVTFLGKYRKISALDAAAMLQKRFPDDTVSNVGASDIVLSRPMKSTAAGVALTILMSLILFFGGAAGIMSFNEDVSADKMYTSVHRYLTGEESEFTPYITIPAAVGVSAGFIAVLQLFRRKKYPPGLLDIDLDLFEDQVDKYIAKRE